MTEYSTTFDEKAIGNAIGEGAHAYTKVYNYYDENSDAPSPIPD